MTNRSRREFLAHSTVTALGALVGQRLAAEERHPPHDKTRHHQHAKAPPRKPHTIRSVRSGKWSDSATWGGRLPIATDIPLIGEGHVIVHDVEKTELAGIVIAKGGSLEFATDRSTAIENTGNVIVEGILRLRPNCAEHVHSLRFLSIDESKFVGDGMEPLDADVGLWTIDAGKLDFLGASKTAWTNAMGSVAKGDTQLEVKDAAGWRIGDTLVVVPTEKPLADGVDWNDTANCPKDPFMAKFERVVIKAIAGNLVTLDAPLAYNHLEVKTETEKAWTAEVANLTRNVRIEGTANGRAHIFIRTAVPQSIRYCEGRYLGPRKKQPGTDRAQLVLGRYALHFHHCYEGSRGTIVEGCAFYDTGNRVYVPHMSHGITMRNNVSFNSMETAFWWDFQEASHDTVWERNLVALVTANGIDSKSMGMSLGQGDGNIARGNVVVYGHHGDPHGHGGYVWDANNEGVWIFENNLSHSNRTGLFVWQNTSLNHTVVNHESYNDYLAIFHGAYGNSYTFTGGYVYAGITRVKATSGDSSGVRFEKMIFDGGRQISHCVDIYPSPAASGVDANVFRQCEFRNAPVGLWMDTFPIADEVTRKHVDLILCDFRNIERDTAFSKESTPDSRFRIQPATGKCSEIVHATGTKEIAPFAPYRYGTGTGLTGRYYVGSEFETLLFARVDSVIKFQQWSYDKNASPFGVHHRVTGDAFSIRWTGQVEPQYTAEYKFHVQGAAGFRLWIDGQKVLDSWQERPDNTQLVDSRPIRLIFGRKYDLRLETINTSGARGCQLFWNCADLGRMVLVPQSQAYPDPFIAISASELNASFRVEISTRNGVDREHDQRETAS